MKIKQVSNSSRSSTYCAGQQASDEHPKVYLAINELGYAICPYCQAKLEPNNDIMK
jgi:uncharacterized Zn-finger protein